MTVKAVLLKAQAMYHICVSVKWTSWYSIKQALCI